MKQPSTKSGYGSMSWQRCGTATMKSAIATSQSLTESLRIARRAILGSGEKGCGKVRSTASQNLPKGPSKSENLRKRGNAMASDQPAEWMRKAAEECLVWHLKEVWAFLSHERRDTLVMGFATIIAAHAPQPSAPATE